MPPHTLKRALSNLSNEKRNLRNANRPRMRLLLRPQTRAYFVLGVFAERRVEGVGVARGEGDGERVEGLGLQQLQRHGRARVQRLELHRRRRFPDLDKRFFRAGVAAGRRGRRRRHAFSERRGPHDEPLEVDEAALVDFDAALGLAHRHRGLARRLRFSPHQRWDAVAVGRPHLKEATHIRVK